MKYNKTYLLHLFILCVGSLLLIIFSSFNTEHLPLRTADRYAVSVIHNWYSLYLELEAQDTSAHPPIAARRLSQLGIVGFLALEHQLYCSLPDDRKTGLLLNELYAKILGNMFKNPHEGGTRIRSLQNELRSELQIQSGELEMLEHVANEITEKMEGLTPKWSIISQAANTDQTLQSVSSYRYSKRPILPNWKYQPVYIFENSVLEIKDPKENAGSSTPFLEEALAVYYASQHLTKEQKWIADFWSDDVRGLTYSPPDRWISIALQLIAQRQADVKTAIELLAKLGIGLNDAVTVCWKYKYTHTIPRPQTMIRTYIDSLWQPYHENPDFPSYPSGHAVIGSTASTILMAYFGDLISFTERSHEGRIEFMGKPRHFRSITTMEKENAWSRMHMGVHYPIDCTEGMRLGREVGARLNHLEISKIFENHLNGYCFENHCVTLEN